MNTDIKRLLDQLIQDRREYSVVDWEASLRAHLEEAWMCGYTTGKKDLVNHTTGKKDAAKPIMKIAVDGRTVIKADLTGIERMSVHLEWVE